MAYKCQFRKKDGTRCNANAQATNGLCVFHDPDKTEDGRRARRTGGINRNKLAVLSLETPDNPLGNTNDVSVLLGESINQVRRGQLDPRVANAIGYLASVLLRALEQGSIEDRLKKIEATLGLAAEARASDVKTKLERSGQWET